MEFIGIDFGTYKTTIASSKENGKILGDEQGKRSIPTLLELTTPIRKFGNSITGEHEQSINLRYRNFRDKTNSQVYMMFIKYLDRLIKQNTKGNPSICISIPSSFTYLERKFLFDISKCCNMKIERFFNDISAIGMFACLRRERVPNQFVIYDFGHSKTEVGFFLLDNFIFTPQYINSCSVGARNFDEKLINLIIKKYNLENTKIVKENIIRHLEKIKTVLNASPVANIQIYINENPINVQITQEEYLISCNEEVKEISKFIDDTLNEINFKGTFEITGGNSSSFLIKNIIDKKFEYQVTLDLTESCAIGTSLGLACSVVSNKYKINDIIGRNINIKLEGSDQKSNIFNKQDIIGLMKTITYNRKKGFNLEILEEDQIIGNLIIIKEETVESESIKIIIEINKFGLINIKSVKVEEKDLEFIYSTIELSNEQKEELINTEEKYRLLETNIEKIGHMRNELETMAMSLIDSLSGNLKELFESEDEEKVREIAMDLFDIPPSTEIDNEYKVREEIIKKLDFVNNKLEKLESKIKEEINIGVNKLNEIKEKFPKKYSPTCYKLQGMTYKLEEYGKKIRIDLFNASDFDRNPFEVLSKDAKSLIEKAEKELEILKKEEEENNKSGGIKDEDDKKKEGENDVGENKKDGGNDVEENKNDAKNDEGENKDGGKNEGESKDGENK